LCKNNLCTEICSLFFNEVKWLSNDTRANTKLIFEDTKEVVDLSLFSLESIELLKKISFGMPVCNTEELLIECLELADFISSDKLHHFVVTQLEELISNDCNIALYLCELRIKHVENIAIKKIAKDFQEFNIEQFNSLCKLEADTLIKIFQESSEVSLQLLTSVSLSWAITKTKGDLILANELLNDKRYHNNTLSILDFAQKKDVEFGIFLGEIHLPNGSYWKILSNSNGDVNIYFKGKFSRSSLSASINFKLPKFLEKTFSVYLSSLSGSNMVLRLVPSNDEFSAKLTIFDPPKMKQLFYKVNGKEVKPSILNDKQLKPPFTNIMIAPGAVDELVEFSLILLNEPLNKS